MTNDKPQVLIVEDNAQMLEQYMFGLRSSEYDLLGVRSLSEAIAALERHRIGVVVTDLELFEHADGGMQVIAKAKEDQAIAAIMITVYSNKEVAARAVHELGARFIPKEHPEFFTLCRRRIIEGIKDWRSKLQDVVGAESIFVPLRSPYFTGKSLEQNNKMFYGRDEVFDFIAKNLSELSHYTSVALIGPRRIGKTSILQQLPDRLDLSRLCLVNISCDALGPGRGMLNFYVQLARQIKRSLAEQAISVSGIPDLTLTDFNNRDPFIAFAYDFLQAKVLRTIEGRRLVFCLDEFEELVGKVQRGRLESTVFELLHALMRDEMIVCILAGTQRILNLGHQSPEAAKVVEMTASQGIGPFDFELSRRLIEEPVAYSDMRYQPQAIETIFKITGGYPYLIQLLCGLLVERRNTTQRNLMTVDDVQLSMLKLIENPQPGFFWESLTPQQKLILYAVVQLHQQCVMITPQTIETMLKSLHIVCQDWGISVRDLLYDLMLEGLLDKSREKQVYMLAFEFLETWMRRHKTLSQSLEELDYEA